MTNYVFWFRIAKANLSLLWPLPSNVNGLGVYDTKSFIYLFIFRLLGVRNKRIETRTFLLQMEIFSHAQSIPISDKMELFGGENARIFNEKSAF